MRVTTRSFRRFGLFLASALAVAGTWSAFAGGPPTNNGPPTRNGDINGDGRLDGSDAVRLVRFLFRDGEPPVPIPQARPAADPTIVYLVRHAEDDRDPDVRRLTEFGRARAELLAERLRDAGLTHVFSSHKTRAFQTAQPTAEDQGLAVEQFPEPGTELPDGETVTESTSTSASIEPTIEVVRAVPPGSVVLVAGHSSTLFAIMAGLGVPVASDERPCEEGDVSCLPCAEKACFPGGFDNLWTVTMGATPAADAAMARLHYGAPCDAMAAP